MAEATDLVGSTNTQAHDRYKYPAARVPRASYAVFGRHKRLPYPHSETPMAALFVRPMVEFETTHESAQVIFS